MRKKEKKIVNNKGNKININVLVETMCCCYNINEMNWSKVKVKAKTNSIQLIWLSIWDQLAATPLMKSADCLGHCSLLILLSVCIC